MTDNDRPDQLPLKERLKKAEYLSRELSEHLAQSYLPALAKLRLASKEFDVEKVSDQQVLDCTHAVLDAEEFTDSLYRRLRSYLDSIRSEIRPIVYPDELARKPRRQSDPSKPSE